MKCSKLILLLLFGSFSIIKAQTATITGVVLNEKNKPLSDVNISSSSNGTSTNADGFYVLSITADQAMTITFSHIGHKSVVLENLVLTTNETFEFNPVMKTDAIQVDEITVTPTGEKSAAGILIVPPNVIRKIPGANAGVENILKLLPGVASNNELSTQYSVRGGNYDENLVYVNEIEVYRPFLIRSAQQEGLSFVNSDMVQNVKFSSGGFQAKYGDKLSSVLDITYKKPTAFGVQMNLSLLGASTAVETVSKNKNFNSVSGLRYRNNALLVNSQQTKTNFNPKFIDLQSYMTFRLSKKMHLNFLGNVSVNDYQNEPISRQTNFGTLSEPRALIVDYEGNEKNRYNTALGALKTTYLIEDNLALKLITSVYHTKEEEHSDVVADYELGDVETDLSGNDLGEVSASRGIGSQRSRARNDLDALIFNLTHKGIFTKKESAIEWGLKYTHEDIRDQLRESEFIDSAGFSIRPPRTEFINNQPDEPFEAPIVPYTGTFSKNFIKTNRFSGFVQYSRRLDFGGDVFYYNVGARSQYWTVSGTNVPKTSHVVLSPRVQLALKPNWKKDMLFRISGGVYHQPPFYREMRDSTGIVRPDVKAQKSFHMVFGNAYSFLLWDRPFTLVNELYYKKLEHVNTYTLEDVRIRYSANNNAEAYAYGLEMRLNGAFVPGTESWLSIGYLKTEENINDRGFISRPTDQRLKLGVLFQDYVPDMPNLRMFLNLLYSTGVPGGSPSYADPYVFQNRLRDYKRADLGISHIFVGADTKYPKKHWLSNFKELSVGVEVFNLFNNQNSITNTWVRDADSKQQFAIPNFMTSRVLNLQVKMRF